VGAGVGVVPPDVANDCLKRSPSVVVVLEVTATVVTPTTATTACVIGVLASIMAGRMKLKAMNVPIIWFVSL
tara:strand:+ start:85775 stop:85990 length:216 start_codon:yes stop_codon:yes gene_type:complete